MKKNLFLMIVLLCAAAQGAWADGGWELVYRQTNTTSANWTALNAGSSTGYTIGTAGTTTYYYATGNLSFTNSTAGGSGITILGTVYLYIPSGVTVICTGHNASAPTGAGAGVELSAGNTLCLIGGGTLNATGGNAANGGNGGKGDDAYNGYPENNLRSGTGGTGGTGGGGAGAGIGTRGGNGGSGGAGGAGHKRTGDGWDTANGNNGSAGNAGTTAGAIGSLYVFQSLAPTVNADGGNTGSSGGNRGNAGWSALWDGSYNWSAPGGGGGGAGGFGGAASNIGTGGPGGGGGGGGAGGGLDWKNTGYYYLCSPGGQGGQNADGSNASDGHQAEVSPTALGNGMCGSNGSWGSNDCSNSGAAVSNGTGGGRGAAGSASVGGSAINLVDWPTSGAGTEESPYLISSVNEWNSFAGRVYTGNSYSGKHIKLTTNISVTTMAGGYHSDENYHPFSGTFDGDGHTLTLNVSNQSRFAAPFKCVSGATIKNLKTAGTIGGTGNDDGKLLAGIVGISFGTTTITGCVSSVTLTTNYGNDAALGGLVAATRAGSLTITGCVFNGSMTGASNTRCAGIAGYEYLPTTTTITNTLFAPATLTVSTTDDGFTKTFTCDGDATIDNCYYTKVLGAPQGTASYFATATAPSNLGDLVQDYGMVKAYANGLLFNGKYYATSGSGAGSESTPYIIDSESALATLARNVNSGVSDFCGKHFSLICDLDLNGLNWTPIGTPDHPFRGNFNGNNHTIRNLTVTNGSNSHNGLFGYVQGTCLYVSEPDIDGCGYIKNIILRNAVIQGGDYTGGFIGHVYGGVDDPVISNLIFQGTVSGGNNYVGGLVGCAQTHTSQEGTILLDPMYPEIRNCLFVDGTITGNGQNKVLINVNGWNDKISGIYFGKNFQMEESSYATRAYPITPDVPSSVSYEIYNTPGGLYDGSHYAPNTTAHFRVNCHDITQIITSVSVNGSQVGTTSGNYNITIDGSQAQTYTVTVAVSPTGITGSGDSENDPYLITNTDQWNLLATYINEGNSFSGKFVKLNANISVSTPLGSRVSDSDNKPFSGTFLGGGHTLTVTLANDGKSGLAPFRCISGATIKDLTVAGTIASSQQHSAGLVGFASGNNSIENCLVTATLNVSSNRAGGIIGNGQSSATTITGCVFAGTINGVDGDRSNIGGIWGWSNSATPTLVNCLEAGTYTNIASMHPMGLQGGSGTITNCYYLNLQIGSPSNACTVSGATYAYATATAPANLGDLVQDYGIVKAYANGLLYAGTYYVARHLSGTGTENDPYIISNNEEWVTFAANVNDGNNYSGKFVKLDANISVSMMAGASDADSFQGTFDGGGQTLTFTKGTAQSAFAEEYCAPFRYVKNAVIKDLRVAGDIYTSRMYAAGLVSQPSGTLTITDCHVSTVIHSSVSGDGTHGGIVARLGNATSTTISGCLFDGRLLTTNGTTSCGGIVGWHDGKTFSITNTLYAPNASITAASGETPINDGATIIRGSLAEGATCYYTETLGTAQGTQVCTAAPEGEINKVITLFNTTVYSASVCTVSGLSASYHVSEAASITPVVAYGNTTLTFGTDFTATLNGNDVAELPLSITQFGTNTLILTGTGDYTGAKTIEIIVLPDGNSDFTLTDGDTYDIAQDCDVASATYRKTTDRVGKFHPWLVPFDYTIKESDTEKFTFYKIDMIAHSSDPSLEASDDIWVFVKRMSKNDVLRANMPYVYKPRVAVTDYAFTTTTAVLKAKNTGVIAKTETMEDIYNFYATYGNTSATAQDPFYYVNIYGELSYGDAVTVGAFRWIIRVESKFGNPNVSYAREMHFFDGEEEETTGIISIENGKLRIDNSSDAWYTIDGVKLDGKPHAKGVYIQNGRKVIIK